MKKNKLQKFVAEGMLLMASAAVVGTVVAQACDSSNPSTQCSNAVGTSTAGDGKTDGVIIP